MRFSQRAKLTPVKVDFQTSSMDSDLRTGLWNVSFITYFNRSNSDYSMSSSLTNLFVEVWLNFFKKPLDSVPEWSYQAINVIRKWFFSAAEWYEVYDFIEFIAQHDNTRKELSFIEMCNNVLNNEISAYRFVDKELTQITDESEIATIEQAINETGKLTLTGVRAHLASALDKLSDRKAPDYRNSIKESISAVEALCKIIVDDRKATLGAALKKLETKIEFHGSLKKAFDALYGYTSDGGGIRHAMLEESNLDFEDAKYMLVSCTAFINYVLVKAQKEQIKI